MRAVLNIIHPNSYKGSKESNSYKIGPRSEFRERDEQFSHLVTTALKHNVPVLHHAAEPLEWMTADALAYVGTFAFDDSFKILFDERIITHATMKDGSPIPDYCLENTDPKIWEKFKTGFFSHTDLGTHFKDAENVLYIGGFLEYCIKKILVYHDSHYRPQHQPQNICYVPELCAVHDENHRQKTVDFLASKNILPLSYAEALKLVSFHVTKESFINPFSPQPLSTS